MLKRSLLAVAMLMTISAATFAVAAPKPKGHYITRTVKTSASVIKHIGSGTVKVIKFIF
jgi:hypothetical protein